MSLSFVVDIDLKKWIQSHDNEYQYESMTSNAIECMNDIFKRAWMLLITSLVKLTFYCTILYFERWRDEISEVFDREDVYIENAKRKFTQVWVWFLHSKCQHTHVISLMEKTHSCNKWQSFKISCSYVITCTWRAYLILMKLYVVQLQQLLWRSILSNSTPWLLARVIIH